MRSLALPPEVDNDVWLTWPPEHSLPLDATAYTVERRDGAWTVIVNADRSVAYTSQQPLELVLCRFPSERCAIDDASIYPAASSKELPPAFSSAAPASESTVTIQQYPADSPTKN